MVPVQSKARTVVLSRQGAWGCRHLERCRPQALGAGLPLHAAEHTDQCFVSIQIKHLFSFRAKYITAAVWLSTGLGCCTPAAPWHLCNGLQSGKHEIRKNYSQELNLKILVLVKPLLLEINVFPEVVGRSAWGMDVGERIGLVLSDIRRVSKVSALAASEMGRGAHTEEKSLCTSWISNLCFTVLIYTPIFKQTFVLN